MKKKVMVIMASAVAALMLMAGCAGATTSSSEVTYSSAMELVTLSDDEMLTSVQNVAKALQENINKTDDTAKVRFHQGSSIHPHRPLRMPHCCAYRGAGEGYQGFRPETVFCCLQ